MMIKEKSKNNLFRHLLFIFIFLITPILVSTRPQGEPFLTVTPPFMRDVIGNVLLLTFFYLNYYVFVPKYYFSGKYIIYIFSVLGFLVIVFVLPSMLTGRLFVSEDGPPPPFTPNNPGSAEPNSGILAFLFSELRHHLYLFFIALFFSFLLRTRDNMAIIKEEKLQAELSSLKSQINPHFLFNTLNSIYALALKKDDKAPEAITHLSGLMRYVIKDAHDYKIPMRNELAYIRNYIELQKARLGNTATINFDIEGEPGSKEIAPLILITYIENAFKYGINPDADDCIINVKIQMTDEAVKLNVFNKKVLRSVELESTGIGMVNTEERLRHLYPGRHALMVNDSNTNYSVTLSIELL